MSQPTDQIATALGATCVQNSAAFGYGAVATRSNTCVVAHKGQTWEFDVDDAFMSALRAGRVVWVLDLHGYDVRGGNAEVFATPQAAMDFVPEAQWEKRLPEVFDDEEPPLWWPAWEEPSGSIGDTYILAAVEIRS